MLFNILDTLVGSIRSEMVDLGILGDDSLGGVLERARSLIM